MRTTINNVTSVVTRSHLMKKDLQRLIEGKILALRIKPFIDEDICNSWKNPISQASQLSRYSNAEDVSVNRIGMTLFETENKAEKLETYFKVANETFKTVEDLLNGDNPIWEIHTALRASWDKGCVGETMEGREMTPGIIRTFEADPKGGLPPHVDRLHKDIPGIKAFRDMKTQLAANLYISTPDEGGELEIWNHQPDEEELETMFNGTHDFIDRDSIPVQADVIKPQVGELILFRSDCIHSVRPSSGGSRIAASCFVGYYGADSPLSVWA